MMRMPKECSRYRVRMLAETQSSTSWTFHLNEPLAEYSPVQEELFANMLGQLDGVRVLVDTNVLSLEIAYTTVLRSFPTIDNVSAPPVAFHRRRTVFLRDMPHTA